MKRISRFALVTLFSLLVLGSSRVFAGNSGGGNNGRGVIGWIEQIIDDIFGDDSNNNQGNKNNQGNPTNGGGGTAPIDGGVTLLLGAGVGLGLSRVVKARRG